VEEATDRLAEPSGLRRELLSRFKDLCVADATVIRLRDALSGAYAGCRTNHTLAAMRLHLVMGVFGAGSRKVTITGERLNERRRLGVGPWVAGRLWYVTHVPATVLSPAGIAGTYAARWEIELISPELKAYLRIAHLSSALPVVVEALIYAAMIGLAVSRGLWRSLRASGDPSRRHSERRVTGALATIAVELVIALAGAQVTLGQRRRWHALRSGEGADPNLGRLTLMRGWAC
jgi:hypothetical protein